MPYIPKEHEKYPVLPYSRARGGEVFQYLSWPEERFLALFGESLLPYGYKSYEEYYAKIDDLLRRHADEPEAVRLLTRCRENIAMWNRKEEWSICKYLGEDTGVLGLRKGGYYYWPSTAEKPEYNGVIDEEEFTAYLYPTKPELWEIVADPTGMAQRTLYGEAITTTEEFARSMGRGISVKDVKNVRTLGPAERLNNCEKRKVRSTEKRNPYLIVPYKIYDATVLEDGKLLIRDETGRANTYKADRFEALSEERIRELKRTPRYRPHRCPACRESVFPMPESYEVCRKCGWADIENDSRLFTPGAHRALWREGKLSFLEWKDEMPTGTYFLRRNLMDGYVIKVLVSSGEMYAYAFDYYQQIFVPDGDAWDVLDRIHGSLAVSADYVEQYLSRAVRRCVEAKIPVVFNEVGCRREVKRELRSADDCQSGEE